jgi:hypothetical protein
LIKWFENNHSIKVNQAAIFTTLKWSAEILAKPDNETNLNAKRQWIVRYLEMESTLVKWFRANQEWANVSGELVKESARRFWIGSILGMSLSNFQVAGLRRSRFAMALGPTATLAKVVLSTWLLLPTPF